MVTDHSNTVYDCGTCGRPIYWAGGQWHHLNALALPCTALVVVEVRLPLPVRDVAAG